MDYNTKADLVAGLAGMFCEGENKDLRCDSSNFIAETISMDSTATGLDMDALMKTKNVIDDHLNRFSGKTDPVMGQLSVHLIIAKKCVEEIISWKLKHEKKDVQRFMGRPAR